jgi:DNA-binding MarR family transcriptional regulator
MATAKPRFGYHFAKLHRLMVSLCKNDIRQMGIQSSQMPFIAELLHYDHPVTQDELSAALVIDKAATARALDQLERHGFVSRVVNPENRRQKLVTATDKARRIQSRFYGTLQAASDVFTRHFSDEDLSAVLELMNRMISNAMDVDKSRA